MSDKTSIEWTATVNPDGSITNGATWNPLRGCTPVSPGCAHCYAETFAERFRGVKGHPYEQGFDLRLVPEKLTEPLSWRKPRRVFVNSMSDLFQDGVPDDYIDRVFAVMALTPQHTYQVLTKRPERMRAYLAAGQFRDVKVVDVARQIADAQCVKIADVRQLWIRGSEGTIPTWPLSNVWLGVSVENQHFADERIPLLLQTPAAVRFISAEPLLGKVSIGEFVNHEYEPANDYGSPCSFCGVFTNPRHWSMAVGLDWVIVGGESGPGARPFDLAWARSIVTQCKAAGVACFVKQLGAKGISSRSGDYRDEIPLTLRNKKGGDPTEWPADLRVREFPRVSS